MLLGRGTQLKRQILARHNCFEEKILTRVERAMTVKGGGSNNGAHFI